MAKISEEDHLNFALQQRADYIPLEDLLSETSNSGELFQSVFTQLTNRTLRTIVGPRGCGKTHMMRYAWLRCSEGSSLPFAVYVSFNRYFRLEPLLSSQTTALSQFHSWVLARVLLALRDSIQEWSKPECDADTFLSCIDIAAESLQSFVTKMERNQPLDDETKSISDSLSIDKTQLAIDRACEAAGRKFSILLMDDAALTLTPDYLLEFLDIVRSLKSKTIAPKASVYPGTTEVSPKFHQGQDAIAIPVWLSIEDPSYEQLMQDIAVKRVKGLNAINQDAQSILRFAAFGIPRAYLTMLDEFTRGGFRTVQQGVNRIVQEHGAARISEFRSIGLKIPKFESLISTGETVLHEIVRELKRFNETLRARFEKALVYGVREDEITPIVDRMFKLMVEAGLIYEGSSVKHGTPARIYRRFIPHTSMMLAVRAIESGGAGGTLKQTLDGIAFKSTKHPLRKSLVNVATAVDFAELNFSLPKCAACGTRRVTDNQRFCHNCGSQLVDASTFNQCLDKRIDDVPGLTAWQREQIAANLPTLKTIRDFLAKQDPAAELLNVRGFGERRTARIIDVLNGFVDDYLS